MSVLAILVTIVLGLVALAGVAIGVMIWVGRRLRGAEAWIRAQLADGERVVLEPTVGNYRGASARYGRVTGVAMLAVSDRRVFVAKALGARFTLPLADVASVREDRWFLRAYNGEPHAILTLGDGVEVGLQVVRDHDRWCAALRAAIKPAQA